MAAYASWRMMPTSLLAALPADAVINHQVTGWQCPSLTWGWWRRARFLPAWQRTALSCSPGKRCSGTAAKPCISSNISHAEISQSALQMSKLGHSGNVQTPLFCSFLIHQALEAFQPVVWLWDTKPLEKLPGTAEDFSRGRAFAVLELSICSSSWC